MAWILKFSNRASVQLLSDWSEILYDDTRFSVCAILMSRIFQEQEGGVRISEFFRHLYKFPCLVAADISTPLIWELAVASVRRYFSLMWTIINDIYLLSLNFSSWQIYPSMYVGSISVNSGWSALLVKIKFSLVYSFACYIHVNHLLLICSLHMKEESSVWSCIFLMSTQWRHLRSTSIREYIIPMWIN